MELSSPKIKKFDILHNPNLLYFFQKKPVLKKFLIFREMELSCPKQKNSYISGGNLQSLKNTSLYFF